MACGEGRNDAGQQLQQRSGNTQGLDHHLLCTFIPTGSALQASDRRQVVLSPFTCGQCKTARRRLREISTGALCLHSSPNRHQGHHLPNSKGESYRTTLETRTTKTCGLGFSAGHEGHQVFRWSRESESSRATESGRDCAVALISTRKPASAFHAYFVSPRRHTRYLQAKGLKPPK